jgi:hypothetical protein
MTSAIGPAIQSVRKIASIAAALCPIASAAANATHAPAMAARWGKRGHHHAATAKTAIGKPAVSIGASLRPERLFGFAPHVGARQAHVGAQMVAHLGQLFALLRTFLPFEERVDDNQQSAIDIFAAQKQCEQQRKELKQLITYSYGNDAWQQFTDIERRVREKQREQVYRRREIIEGLIEFALWFAVVAVTVVISGVGLYFWGRYLGRW